MHLRSARGTITPLPAQPGVYVSIDGPDDLEALRRIGAIVAEARDAMLAAVRPGVHTAELDAVGRDVLTARGARSAPQLVYNFPGATCVSVNDAVAHGIPRADVVLKAGDVVNVDVSAELDGYFADTGASAAVGVVSDGAKRLLAAAREALEAGMAEARAGQLIHAVGRAVERTAARRGLHVIRDLSGHGVGRAIHEEPAVPNYFEPRLRARFTEGLVVTIEPFLTLGAETVVQDDDGWTLRTPDGTWGAQFEHTIVITRDAPIVIT